MSQTRRDFIKTSVALSVAGTLGISVPEDAEAETTKWKGRPD